MDGRTMIPLPFLAYYPAMIRKSELDEQIHILGRSITDGRAQTRKINVGYPITTEPLGKRDTYEPTNPVDISSFGRTKLTPLGEVALARSGDKGANVNIGLFVHTSEEYDWLRSILTTVKMKELMGEDWKSDYWLERVEFPRIKAVHFVIYGPLSRGISSSPFLDGLGKGFADFIRARYVDVPVKFLK
jgi:hypothetical protein